MNWFEQRIRRYEHRRWTTDDNRRVRPFEWGTEHVGGSPEETDPQGFFAEWARRALQNSRDWYETTPASDYRLGFGKPLAFSSSMPAPWPEKRPDHAPLLPPNGQ